ncbi:spirocyclase AveC family protein [Mycolicibacter engbaekii]|uniref:spirocyclase AveC family protein n=1 Tax=Mycolicibacter engbaekii TaxID=188915 RepID=UPI000A14EC6E|nr:spirocyclase AveC family protein [Mycolicibacter engbaekii]
MTTSSVTTDGDTMKQLWVGAKESPPIVWLARLGAVFVVFQLYVYLRWIFSDSFASTPAGPDPIPASSMFWIRFWEIGCVLLGIGLLWWIVRKLRAEREFPPIGIFVVAWLLAAWQDPGVNATRPVFAYNSGFFNRGTWGEFIPGWVSKGAENPQPLIYFLASYIVLTPLAIMGIDKLIGRLRTAAPRLNRAGVLGLMVLLFTVIDIVMEQFFHRVGLWTYLRVDGSWSIFTGHLYQFPLYEGVFFGGIVSTLSIAIYCFRDKDGRMITDAGIEKLRNKRVVPLVRILALTGVFNVIMMVFMLGFNLVNQHADTQPAQDIPSYLHHDMCGLGPNPPCPPLP